MPLPGTIVALAGAADEQEGEQAEEEQAHRAWRAA